MSIKFDSMRKPLAEIIREATINATYVIPDLQRPFVWSPRQVTMLIDSLFRGWPFGSLLLWEVKPDCFRQNEGLPHRPFWQVVDRTGADKAQQSSAIGQPATYQMILDGQQRVQSLILALGGDQWGFQLFDADWSLDLHERRVKPSKHWSKASLCIDLDKFKEELSSKSNVVRKIEAGKILEWAILDSISGQSQDKRPANYVYPLATAIDNPGQFIRLSRFWDLAQKDLSESEYKTLLRPMLKDHAVKDEDLSILLDPLAEFMILVERVKTNSYVHALRIESFQVTPQWGRDDYSDAIVNIFTRLNTAGRTLTREEITLAWLKVGWVPEQTGQKTAGQCLDELKALLGDKGFRVETDDIVRLISFIWSVEKRNGILLDSKDLLKGEIIRPMAASIASMWNQLHQRIMDGSDIINKRELIENVGSFNAVIVFLTWYQQVFGRFEVLSLGLPVVERDSLEKTLRLRTVEFLDRWIFGSQWANVWGDGAVLNFQNFAADLHESYAKLQKCPVADLIATVDEGIQVLMLRVTTKATFHINNLIARDRRRVHIYYSFLWVWHRLEPLRWKNSSIPMRTGRKRTSKLEVDHTVADAWWIRLVSKEIDLILATFAGTDEERALVAPDDFESKADALAFINLLGNCSLLEKSFNISKSAEPMRDFLKEVHEFKEQKIQLDEWEAALSLTTTLTSPAESTLSEITNSVKSRDALIRKDLLDFIAGSKVRADIEP